MNIVISNEITELLPEFKVLAFKFQCEVKESDDLIKNKIKEYEDKYADVSLEEVLKLERIKEARDAYKKLGKDPSRYRLACESLLRRLSKKMGLYYINNMVDIGNLLSIELNRSTAVLDYDKIVGDIEIRLGKVSDEYYGIGRGLINVSNIPVYVDSVSPFGSTTSDTLRTSITEETKNILLFVICFKDNYIEESIKITNEMYKNLGGITSLEEVVVKYKR